MGLGGAEVRVGSGGIRRKRSVVRRTRRSKSGVRRDEEKEEWGQEEQEK